MYTGGSFRGSNQPQVAIEVQPASALRRDKVPLFRQPVADIQDNNRLSKEEEAGTWKIAGYRRGRGRGRGPQVNNRGGEPLTNNRGGGQPEKNIRWTPALTADRHVGTQARGRSTRGGRGGVVTGSGFQSRGNSFSYLDSRLGEEEWPSLINPSRQRSRERSREGIQEGSDLNSNKAMVPYHPEAGTRNGKGCGEVPHKQPSLRVQAEVQADISKDPGFDDRIYDQHSVKCLSTSRRRARNMSSGCMNSVGCVDSQAPVRATYLNLYKWPESDAEFVKSVAGEKRDRGHATHNQTHLSRTASGRRRWSQSPRVVDSYSCRQMYLRSYTFSKKETVPEKTKKCLAKVKERASLFAKDNVSVSSYGSRRSKDNVSVSSYGSRQSNTKEIAKKKKKKKGCVAMVKKIKDASCSAFFSLFRHLLSCTTTVDVVDTHPSQ
ncbi:hypothetical protein J5N97_014883 [Dioscorea zingiberensis]|uniref:Uncharacterized protein n=1 Tax=Dioscorea zingiberensis TaxID=325984 RepID=A0A9D5CUY1_9LILI|nr:hypothetical protein J5N97_014883 [Dioscorea zingiberensis]